MSAEQLTALATLITAIGGVIALFVKTTDVQNKTADVQAKTAEMQQKVTEVHEQTNGRLDALIAENTQLKAQLAGQPPAEKPA